jgi:hypothetical protein
MLSDIDLLCLSESNAQRERLKRSRPQGMLSEKGSERYGPIVCTRFPGRRLRMLMGIKFGSQYSQPHQHIRSH